MGGTQEFRVTIETHDVGVTGDRPKPLAKLVVTPGSGIFAPEPGESVERRPVNPGVVARKIHMAIILSGPHRHPLFSPKRRCIASGCGYTLHMLIIPATI
jgi:hypothetical protein